MTDFRKLIDRGLSYGGRYYLTYHRWATREQVLEALRAAVRAGAFAGAVRKQLAGGPASLIVLLEDAANARKEPPTR